MASFIYALLLFLAQLHILFSTSSAHADAGNLTRLSVPFLCNPDQAETLLQLKKSFSFVTSTTMLWSWQNGTDCCLWEGVACDASSGNVTILNLNNRGLSSNALDPVVFSLASLRRLDLSMNDFGRKRKRAPYRWPGNIPATGFDRFTLLTHLNLSNSGFFGRLPTSMSKLVNLVSLDLSSSYDYVPYDSSMISYSFDSFNSFWEPNFDNLVANLSNLRELYLDGVDLSHSGEDWSISLASSVHRLQVLSLANCNLIGPIHKSLIKLNSLNVVNLRNNDITAGPFPELFMDFVNLTVLQLSNTNLEGWFPPRSFQSKHMRVLDLSANWDLAGHLPNLSNPYSLETLRLGITSHFPYSKPLYSNNFLSLKELSLEGEVSVDSLSSFGRLGSLCQLDLSSNEMELSELTSIFSWIRNQKNLLSLTVSGFDFSLVTTSFMSNFKNLRILTMVECNVPRSILSAFGNLTDLRTLEVNDCTTDGLMPSSIGSLTNLRNMRIMSCGFLGQMPAAIANLTNLRNMYITEMFSGPMPAAIGNLTNLKTMEIESDFIGTVPYAIGQLKKLTRLILEGCNFSGSIPSSIVNLTQLTILDLSGNSLDGEIPSPIFTLPVLRDLDLSWNQLSGPIREFDKAPSQLKSLDLSNNEFSGPVPKSFFQMISLKHLDVSWNNLRGLVDLTSFWGLRELASLYLSNNKLYIVDLEGDRQLPADLSGPNELGLASCNIINFPRSLVRINFISYLDLSCNKINGDVPKHIWETWSSSLIYLNLSHNMFTSIGLASDVLPFTNALDALDLSFNRLWGRVPMPNSSAQILDYSNNRFSSILPNWISYLSYTNYLSMSRNSINGHVPISICNSSILGALDLSYNKFTGFIPSCLIENGRLGVLNLRNNHFEGTLPSNIATRCALQTMDLHGNKIEGLIPRALSHCTDLELLDLGGNQIADIFPSWLCGFSNLRVLVLKSNQFYGTITNMVGYNRSKECFPSLQIIDLASNNFSGTLRPQWFERLKLMISSLNSSGEPLYDRNISIPYGQSYRDFVDITYKGSDMTFETILTTLTAIDLSNNRLEGTIPKSIGRLVALRVLNLSHNAFIGKIPAQLGGMVDLESLDLSCNHLSGEIPQELTNLTFLGLLNLSYNNLLGKIPQSRQFSTFDSSSFEGNVGLCGPPLSKLPCGVSPYTPSVTNVQKSSHHVDVVLFLFVGLGFGVGFAAAILVKWGRIGRWFIAQFNSFANLILSGR